MDFKDSLLHITKEIEKQVDSAIEKYENLDATDFEYLRQKRIKELKEREAKIIEWKLNGHGVYEELPEEKKFFDIIKKSENIVLHFYTNSNERCKIVDKHFKMLAPKHVEALFTKLNAEKSPFLADKLKIKVIPSIVCIHNGIMIDKLVGFATLGNRDDFSTEDMEWRLGQSEVIQYDGDLGTMPSEQKATAIPAKANGRIRNGIYNGDDDDLYIEEIKPMTQKNFELTAEEEAELEL